MMSSLNRLGAMKGCSVRSGAFTITEPIAAIQVIDDATFTSLVLDGVNVIGATTKFGVDAALPAGTTLYAPDLKSYTSVTITAGKIEVFYNS